MLTHRRNSTSLPQIQTVVKNLKQNGQLTRKLFKSLLSQISPILRNQGNLLYISSPVFVVGDIHGQFYDLLNIFQTYGTPQTTKFLFLGDYVDRGVFSIEVITLLFAYKLRYPNNISLLRGNHQCRSLTQTFNFKKQCLAKYDQAIYDQIMQTFDLLSLAAVIDHKYFAVHGGISPSCESLRDIQQIDRFREVPIKGGFCDLLWSDPVNYSMPTWKENNLRQCSYLFGTKQSSNFLIRNSLKMIIRGHQVEQQGFKYQKLQDVSLTLTIFSAPNYGNIYKNKGCIASIKGNDVKLFTFGEVSQPITLPNFQNVFEWTLPFMGQCLQHFSDNITKLDTKKLQPNLKKIVQDRQKLYKDLSLLEMVKFIDKIMNLSAADRKLKLSIKQQTGEDTICNVNKFNKMKQSDKNQKFPQVRQRSLSQEVIGPKIHIFTSKIKLIESQDQFENQECEQEDISASN